MNKRLQGRFREIIHNYTLYYFVYMYTQICDENTLIWGFPPPTDVPATSHVKFWLRKQPIFVFICEGD